MHPSLPSDWARLLHAARGGDREACARFLEPYRPYIDLLLYAQLPPSLRGKADPADLAQDTLTCVLTHLGDFRGDTEQVFLRWLREIVATTLSHFTRHYLGTAGRDVRRERDFLDHLDRSSAALYALAAPDTSPASRAARHEHEVLVAQAVAALPDDLREVVLLHYLRGLTLRDIAAHLGLTVANIRSRWRRGLDQLRARLEGLA